MTRIGALTALVAVSALAAPLPVAGARTTAVQFNHKANAVCATAGDKIEKLPGTDSTSLVKNFRAQIKIINTMVRRLDAIEAPKAQRAQYRSFVAVQRQQVAFVEKSLAAAKAKDTKRAAALLFQVVKKGQRGVRLATDLDLSDCARDYYPGVTNPNVK